jgi:hypothetical protein
MFPPGPLASPTTSRCTISLFICPWRKSRVALSTPVHHSRPGFEASRKNRMMTRECNLPNGVRHTKKAFVQWVLDQFRNLHFPGPHDRPHLSFIASEAYVRRAQAPDQPNPNKELNATQIPTCEASSPADQDGATGRVAGKCPLSRSCCCCGNDWTAGVLHSKDHAWACRADIPVKPQSLEQAGRSAARDLD